MTYKRIEIENLQKVAMLASEQVASVTNFLTALDNMQQVPIVSDAVALQELIYSTNNLLTLTNNILMEETANTYGKEIVTSEQLAGHGFLNIPNAITHSLNLEELDNDFDEEYIEDEENLEDEDRPPAT